MMHDEENVIETTVEDTPQTETKKGNLTVALSRQRSIDIEITYETTQPVIERAANDADALVSMFVDLITARSEEETIEKKKTAFNTAISYLVGFNVNMLDYLTDKDREEVEIGVIVDAIAISRAIRNFIITQANEEQT